MNNAGTDSVSGAIYYYSPVSNDDLNRRFNQSHYSGAATNKVFGVCGAMRSAKLRATVVSGQCQWCLGRPLSEALRTSSIPYVRTFSLGRGVLKRITSAVGLLLFTIMRVRRGDRVILYNFFPEYIPAALYLKIILMAPVLDVEDGPRSDEQNFRGVVNVVSYALIKALSQRRYLTVSRVLARQLQLNPSISVYGSARSSDGLETGFKLTGGSVSVLFGGAIVKDTGLELFQKAVEIVVRNNPDAPLRFCITGHYPKAVMESLALFVRAHSSIQFETYYNLSGGDYKKLLSEIDVGLSLKLPSREMGQTTFPSKVIEYVSMGILLISTRVSDVPEIFDDSNAVLLNDEDPKELAEKLVAIATSRGSFADRAERGREMVEVRFAPKAIGREMREFLR